MARIITAGVLGGIAMFIWSSLAHVALPLGEIGVSEISNDQGLLDIMRATIGEKHGFYAFPSGGNTTDAASAEQYTQKVANGPSGILVYHPSGGQFLSTGQLVTEFLSEVLSALLAVILLAQTRLESYASRVGFVTIAGILASLPTNLSYWNWYGFPSNYTAAYMSIQIAGFVVAGLVAAAIVGRRASSVRRN